MPLEKSISKKAFGHNIGAELKAGKPRKQAIAIAFSEKREAQKKHKIGTSDGYMKHSKYTQGLEQKAQGKSSWTS